MPGACAWPLVGDLFGEPFDIHDTGSEVVGDPVLELHRAERGQLMSIHILLLSAAALFLPILPSHAGPCSSEVDRMQVKVDARIEAIAGAGPSAKESTAALLNRQPTPGSIAAAEEKLGEGRRMEEAVAALARAREADRTGDKSACERALADAQRAIGP